MKLRANYMLVGVIGLLQSLLIIRAPLSGDEPFLLFNFANYYADNPGIIWSTALDSAKAGWDAGRFAGPHSHALALLGLSFTDWVSQIFGIDIILAYGLIRSVINTGIFVSMFHIFRVIYESSVGSTRMNPIVLRSMAVVVPSSLVLNRTFASGRSFIWSYGLNYLIALLTVIAVIRLSRNSPHQVQRNALARIRLLAAAVSIGLVSATTYEVNQVLIPFTATAAIAVLYCTDHNSQSVAKKLRSIARNQFLFIYCAVAIGMTLVIQVHSLGACKQGCYAPAEVRPSGLELDALFSRMISGLPPFPHLGLLHYPTSLETRRYNSLFFAAVILVIWLLAREIFSQRRSHVVVEQGNLVKTGLGAAVPVFILLGLVHIFSIALGSTLTREVQEKAVLRDLLTVSNRDSLYLCVGGSLLIGALIVLAGHTSMRSKRVSALGLLLLVPLSFATSVRTNVASVTYTLKLPPAIIQTRLALEISNPDTSERGDQRRCELIKTKLASYREWRGHDALVVTGLNRAMERRIGQPFCTVTESDLFLDYP